MIPQPPFQIGQHVRSCSPGTISYKGIVTGIKYKPANWKAVPDADWVCLLWLYIESFGDEEFLSQELTLLDSPAPAYAYDVFR